MLEHLARIVRRRRYAFLFRNRIFRTVDKILRRTLDSHDREEAERYGEHLSGRLAADSAVDAAANGFGKLRGREAGMAAAAFAGLHDLGVEDDRIHDLKDSDRQIRSRLFRTGAAAEILCAGLALENVDIALAAVKNDFFLYDRDSFDLLRSADAGAYFTYDFDIHGDADLIKTAVKRHGIDLYVRADDLSALGPNASASLDKIASDVRKINDDILIAVLITAAIKNSIGVYIYRIATRSAADRRGISDIWHKIFPPI